MIFNWGGGGVHTPCPAPTSGSAYDFFINCKRAMMAMTPSLLADAIFSIDPDEENLI